MKVCYDDLLSYELMYELYINQRLSSIKIGEKLGISKPVILKRLKKFGLTKDMQQNTYKLNDLQNDFIVGSALGDGSFRFEGVNYRMSFRQAENQKEYLEFKLKTLSQFTNYKEVKQSDGNYKSFENAQMMYYFHTKALPVFNEFATYSISEKIKMLNKNSFSIWLMDDGSLHKKNMKKGYSPYYTLSIKRFSEKEVGVLERVLSEKLRLKYSIRKNGSGKYLYSSVYFPVSETSKISDMIKTSAFSEDLIRTMNYKIDY